MNKTVLVTGAAGYIGRHVVNALLELDIKVIAVDFNTDQIDSRAHKVQANLFAEPTPELTHALSKAHTLLHLAWRDGFKHNSEAHITDLPSHYQFIKQALEAGIKHVAVMGTMHEIGYWEGAITEDSPCNPASYYGISKNALRKLTEMLCTEHEAVFQWLRAYYIVGDDKFGNSIFSKLLSAAEEGKTTFPFTSGKNLYDFISVQDLATQIATASAQDEVNGIINVCSGTPLSLADRVEKYIEEHSLPITLEYGAFPDRPYDSPGVWGDNSKIQAILAHQK